MSDKNIDKDILLLREIQANFKLEEGINREISGIYNSVTKRFIHDYMIVNSIENVLINLKIKEIENKDLTEKLYIQENITEKWVKIAEKLAEELSKHIWLNDKDAILKIYREKVEEDETYS